MTLFGKSTPLILAPTVTQTVLVNAGRAAGSEAPFQQVVSLEPGILAERETDVLRALKERGMLADPRLDASRFAAAPDRVELRRVFLPFVANGFTCASAMLVHELTTHGVSPDIALGLGMMSFYGFAGLLYLMRDKTEAAAGKGVQLETLPTIGELVKGNPFLQEVLTTLTNLLKEEKKMLTYFNLDPDLVTFRDIVDLMAHIRVVEGRPEEGASLVRGAYDFVKGVIYLGNDTTAAVHECSHALHHVALSKKLTYADIKLIVEVFPEVVSGKDLEEYRAFLDEVEAFVRDGEVSAAIPHSIRLKAGTLAFAMGARQNLAGMESIGTRFHFAAGGFKQLMVDIIGNYIQWPFFGPITMLSGDYKRARLNAVLGYSNPLAYWYFRSQGLVEAMLPLDRRSRPSSWVGRMLRSALEFHSDETSGFRLA